MIPIDVKIDSERLSEQMQRASESLNISTRESVTWGASLVAKSVGARTIVSKKNRDVIEMPVQRTTIAGESDKRFARFGVYRWIRGARILAPLAGKGKGAYARYKSIGEAKGDRRVKIGRRGLAKKSWQWAARNTINGGEASIMGVGGTIGIRIGGGYSDASRTIENRLRYATEALEGGTASINDAMNAASNKMEKLITDRLSKAVS